MYSVAALASIPSAGVAVAPVGGEELRRLKTALLPISAADCEAALDLVFPAAAVVVKWSEAVLPGAGAAASSTRVAFGLQPAVPGGRVAPLLVDCAPALSATGSALEFAEADERSGSGARAGSGVSDASAGGEGDAEPRLIPTIHALWRAPGLLPHLLVPPHASSLVLSGCAMWEDIYTSAVPRLPEGALVAIRVVGNPAPIAVGVLSESTEAAAVAGFRGQAVLIKDVYRSPAAAAAGGAGAGGAGAAGGVPNEGFLAGEVRPVAAGREELERFLALPSSAVGGTAASESHGAVSAAKGSATAYAPKVSAAAYAAPAAALAGSVAAAGLLGSSIRGYLPPLTLPLYEPAPVTHGILRTVLRLHGGAGGAAAAPAVPWQPATDLTLPQVRSGSRRARESIVRMALAAAAFVPAGGAAGPRAAAADADCDSEQSLRSQVDDHLFTKAELEAAFHAYIAVRGLRRAGPAAPAPASAAAAGGAAAAPAAASMVKLDSLFKSLLMDDADEDLELDFHIFGDDSDEDDSGDDDDEEEDEEGGDAGSSGGDEGSAAGRPAAVVSAARAVARAGSGGSGEEQLIDEDRLLRAFMARMNPTTIIVLPNAGMVAAARMLPPEAGCTSGAAAAALGYVAGHMHIETGPVPIVRVTAHKRADDVNPLEMPKQVVVVTGLEAYGLRESAFKRELAARGLDTGSAPASRSGSAESATSTGSGAGSLPADLAAIVELLTAKYGFGLPAEAVVVTEVIRRPRNPVRTERHDRTPEERMAIQEQREARLELLRAKGKLHDRNSKKGKAALRGLRRGRF